MGRWGSMDVHFPSILFFLQNKKQGGNSLVVQWLGLRASTAGSMGSIPGRGTKIPPCCAVRPKKINKKQRESEKVEGSVMCWG